MVDWYVTTIYKQHTYLLVMPRFVAVSIFAANAHQTDMRSIEVFFSKYFPAVAHLSAYLFGEKKIRKMPRERERVKVETMWCFWSFKYFHSECSWTRKVWIFFSLSVRLCMGSNSMDVNWTFVWCIVHCTMTIISFVTLIVSTEFKCRQIWFDCVLCQ